MAAIWPRLPEPLWGYALLSDDPPRADDPFPPERRLAGAGDIAVEGWLGAFWVTARLKGQVCAVHERLIGAGSAFDLILDLMPEPLLSLPVLPPGYYAPGPDARRLAAALDELPEMTGSFEKPKYFTYDARLCAHDTGSVRGCGACLDVCGAGAIASENGAIRVNPYLCQGCGDCTGACPSGALRYARPSPGESLQRLRWALDLAPQAAVAPWLVLVPGEEGEKWWANCGQTAPVRALPFPLEALGAAGLEFWLAALAFGAAGIALPDLPGVSALTRNNLHRQLAHGRALLDALGIGSERLAFPWTPDLPELGPACPPATFVCLDDKRDVLHLALEHLRRHAPLQAEETILPAGAPTGSIRVDGDRCTLCLACVHVCPTAALKDGRDEPALSLIEANCVQCSRCVHACPEDAMVLEPRYLFDRPRARTPRLLHREAVFRCPECGRPFATERMIRTIAERLKDHPLFQGDKRRRLSLCEDCRIRAAFFAGGLTPAGGRSVTSD